MPESKDYKESVIRDYKELLRLQEDRLKELEGVPYNSQHRDCENAIKKYKAIIKELEDTKMEKEHI